MLVCLLAAAGESIRLQITLMDSSLALEWMLIFVLRLPCSSSVFAQIAGYPDPQ